MKVLRIKREERGLPQHGLAYLAKVPQPVISMAETRGYRPNPTDLAALARVLGVQPPERLLDDVVVPDVVESQEVAR